MRFLISGYFGYQNAGDEAVLAAMLGHLRALRPLATYTATSGDPEVTAMLHGCETVPREGAKQLLAAIRASDVFLSGGGSLIQDVTSLRNVVYYTGLIRMARLLRKPVMIYAQGVGPLRKPISQKLARAAFQRASRITLRDPDSKALLEKIGVKKEIEVTADPVWDLKPAPGGEVDPLKWIVALRSWPGAEIGSLYRLVTAIRVASEERGAKLRFLPMQPGPDHEILHGCASYSEVLPGGKEHPSQTLARAGGAGLMLAMRLHALIFAASQGVPTIAFNYDPKVASLAKLLGAPLIEAPSEEDLARLPEAIAAARAPAPDLIADFKAKARRNAEIAVELAGK